MPVSDQYNGDVTGFERAPNEAPDELEAPVYLEPTAEPVAEPSEPEIIVRTSTTPRTKPGEPQLKGLRRLSQHAKPAKPQRDIRAGRIGVFALAALFLVAIPWFVVSQLASTHHPPKKPKAHAITTPSIGTSAPAAPYAGTPLPRQTSDAGVYELVGKVSCIHIRAQPSVTSSQINCLPPHTRLISDGQYKLADGYAWLHVEDPNTKLTGWVATVYVKLIRRTS
ncbi:MAG: SH3 domain-containing protein [Actinomycetota bacterium]